MNECRYHCSVASSYVHAPPTAGNAESQLFGGVSGPPPSRQTYQSRFGFSREDRDSTNHGCWSEVWLGTKSTTTLMPRSCAAATRASKSASVPNCGSTSR
jgi:hypothetical protein